MKRRSRCRELGLCVWTAFLQISLGKGGHRPVDLFRYQSYADGRRHGAFPHSFQLSQEDERQCTGNKHQRHIKSHFGVGKFQRERLT